MKKKKSAAKKKNRKKSELNKTASSDVARCGFHCWGETLRVTGEEINPERDVGLHPVAFKDALDHTV